MGKGKKNALCGAVIGYGAAYNMGRFHLEQMTRAGITPVAACDTNPERAAAAKDEWPHIDTYTRVAEMVARDDIDLVALIVPHFLHAKIAMTCLEAGKHLIVEKPMCVSVKEADGMIALAKKNKVTLSVFHNRRLDADFLIARGIVASGLLGKLFQIDCAIGGYGQLDPSDWRGQIKTSGGTLYDWGAHFVDWILHYMDGRRVTSVVASGHDGVFPKNSNPDHMRATLHFEDGAVANLTVSHLTRIPMPRYRLLGELGSLEDDEKNGCCRVVAPVNGIVTTQTVDYPETDYTVYYKRMVDHLVHGKPLDVTPESARRVIRVLEAAMKSYRRNGAVIKITDVSL